MDIERHMTIAAGIAKMSKPALADYLIEHGTVYPNRAGLLKWTKDELVNSVTERVIEVLDSNAVSA